MVADGEALPSLVAVTICTMAGNSHEVRVPENATVQQAKEEVERLLGFRPIEQRLIIGGQVLDDDLKPFAQLEPGTIVQLVRVPFMSLKRFIKSMPQLTNKDVAELKLSDLMNVFQQAAERDQPDVCAEILTHSSWGPGATEARLLSAVASGGFARVFKDLVDSEYYGRLEGVLDRAHMALHTAAKRGLPLHCEALLASPHFTAAATRSASTNATALHHAANDAMLRLLLANERLAAADCINARDRKGCTCLHYASTEEAARVILEQPAFTALDDHDDYGQTALHTARVPGVCAAIIEHPLFTAINALDDMSAPPLHYLVRTTAALPLLEARRKVLEEGGADGSGAASSAGSHPHAALHLDIDAVDNRGRTALFHVRSGEVCRALFDAGFSNIYAQEKTSGQSALQERLRHVDVVREILARSKLEPDDMHLLRAHDALDEATASGSVEVAEALRRAIGRVPRPRDLPAPGGEALLGRETQVVKRWCLRASCALL